MGEQLRRLREADIDGVVAAYRTAWGDARPISADEICRWIEHPEVDPDSLRVLEVDGDVVGYGDVNLSEGILALEVAAANRWGVFLEWAEETARASNASRVRVLSYGGEGLPDAAAERGYFLWRSNYTMEIELDDISPAVPSVPDGFKLRPYAVEDEQKLLAAINAVFDIDTDPFYRRMTLEDFRVRYVRDPGMKATLWQLLWNEDDLVAFSLGFSEHHGNTQLAEIRSVGVRSDKRRCGLGDLVVRATFASLHAQGLRTVALGVDASNETGAVQLYESVGMQVVARGDNWALDLN